MDYAVLKFIHLGALIFWLGPALGAWLVLKAVETGTYQPGSQAETVSRVFYLTVLLEHVAFVVLLATGLLMAVRYPWMGADWLNQKLYLVFLVLVPLEIVDIALGNWIASSASRKLYAGKPLKRWERNGLALYHGLFTKIAMVVVPLSVMAIMYLAVGKAGFTIIA